MIGIGRRNGKVVETPPIASADVYFGNIMAATLHPLGNACQVDLNVFRSNVDEHHVEAFGSCGSHHVEVVLS
jgi:hypothetical protein